MRPRPAGEAYGMQGYVQVYTGTGKGKTTAALGLALRAAGAGLRVFIGQFLKNHAYSEIQALQRFADSITIQQYGTGCFIFGTPADADIRSARTGFSQLKEHVLSGKYDLVILDEANVAVHYNMLTVEELLELIDSKPVHVELIITGRNADRRIIERADLVTEMREVKHYYTSGIEARTGIEK